MVVIIKATKVLKKTSSNMESELASLCNNKTLLLQCGPKAGVLDCTLQVRKLNNCQDRRKSLDSVTEASMLIYTSEAKGSDVRQEKLYIKLGGNNQL